MKFVSGRQSHACVACSLLLAVMPVASGATLEATAGSAVREYSIINLVSLDGTGVLNQRGQVAFTGYRSGVTSFGFFDGKRLHTVNLPVQAWGTAEVHDLNDAGVVVIQADDPNAEFPGNARAFSWSLAKGARLLTSSGPGLARVINARGQIAGYVQSGPHSGRANRWNSNGSQTSLGILPTGYSEGMAINDKGMSGGYADDHAVLWDTKGIATDLGTMGGTDAVVGFLNNNDQAAGTFNAGGRGGAFVWCRKNGLAMIGPFDRFVRVTGLNDNGQIAADRQIGQEGLTNTFAPFTWSVQRGLRMLPLGGAAHGRVDALNRRAQMVGYTQRVAFDDTTRRAIAWDDVSAPVDLNTRLYRAPAGLVLSAATAINDDGVILATSNAGLVLLRPGRTGTDAPVLGPLTAPPEADYAAVGNTFDFSVSFVDSSATETHVATADVGDGCPQSAPSLREVRGSGDISYRHTFCQPGFFSLKITVTDRAGNATLAERQVSVR